jgi:hypothetical protein
MVAAMQKLLTQYEFFSSFLDLFIFISCHHLNIDDLVFFPKQKIWDERTHGALPLMLSNGCPLGPGRMLQSGRALPVFIVYYSQLLYSCVTYVASLGI